MLRRLQGVVELVRPVVMVLVRYLLRVQLGVLHIRQTHHRRSHADKRHRLPCAGKQERDEDECAKHF
jgi:hypothetical protein